MSNQIIGAAPGVLRVYTGGASFNGLGAGASQTFLVTLNRALPRAYDFQTMTALASLDLTLQANVNYSVVIQGDSSTATEIAVTVTNSGTAAGTNQGSLKAMVFDWGDLIS